MNITQQPQKYRFRTPLDGKVSYNLDGLFSTLVELKPKYCLEIGTNHGDSARVFQDYFNEYRPDGLVVTLDIKNYADLSELKNVKPIIVYPYDPSVTKWHYVKEGELLTGYDNWSSSLFKNIRIVKDLDIVFDFAFIDGDHCRQSLLNDIELCSQVVQYPHYMLIDDVDDPRHDSTAVFHNELVKDTYHWDTYDYSDWTIKTGIGLLWQQ